MNFKRLASNTMGLGFWGVMTLYQMAFRMLLGMFMLFESDQFDQILDSTSTDKSVTLAQMVGIQFFVSGIMYGMVGSVTDHHTWQRLSAFTMIATLMEGAFAVYLLIVRGSKDGLLLGPIIVLSVIGFLLALIMVSLIGRERSSLEPPQSSVNNTPSYASNANLLAPQQPSVAMRRSRSSAAM